jgi:hypothetical protein
MSTWSAELTADELAMLSQLAAEEGLTVKEWLRQQEIRRELGAEDEAFIASANAALTSKQERDRVREQFRNRKRLPRGFWKDDGGRVRLPEERKLESQLPTVTPSEADYIMLDELRRLVSSESQPGWHPPLTWEPLWTVARQAQVRAAFEAISGGVAVERWWQRALSFECSHALRVRLGGSPYGGGLTGTSILGRLREHHGALVPDALTPGRIDALLDASTLSRGGGSRRSLEHELDKLVRELGQEPWHTRAE